jgi:hypothetical protein
VRAARGIANSAAHQALPPCKSAVSEPFFPKALVEKQNKELSDLLWKRSEGERQLIAAETTFAQVIQISTALPLVSQQ